MQTVTICAANELPSEIAAEKEKHYREVFGSAWSRVWEQSPLLADGEKALVVTEADRPIAWTLYTEGAYDLSFRTFYVDEAHRSRGLARQLMHALNMTAESHHDKQLASGGKPADIRLMYLKSMIYPYRVDGGGLFAFGAYLCKMGFQPYAYNKNDITPEETVAASIYEEMPDIAGTLRVFKRIVVCNGVTLSPEIQTELSSLGPDIRAVVSEGLRWKLGHFAESGRVSYRSDLCPICKYVQGVPREGQICTNCPIPHTCGAPFRRSGRFKENYQVSGAFFQAVQLHLLAHSDR